MTWQRQPVADALVALLEQIDPAVSVFAAPPSTLNPPAYVVWWPTTVAYNAFTFGVDLVTLPVLCAAGAGEFDRVDALIAAGKQAVDADPTLAGVVGSCVAATQSNWRLLSVGGADVLAADLVLEIRR